MNKTSCCTVLHHRRPCRCGCLRVDYVYRDTHASLGLAVMFRAPVAFLSPEDRPEYDMTKYLPPALPLHEVAKHLGD